MSASTDHTLTERKRDVPVEDGPVAMEWGSDAVAAAMRALQLPYMTLNPGASFRALHDSIVNYCGNAAPEMLLCLHEEHVVSIAHGYGKLTERAMAAALHSNVGLMHASMDIYCAYCDRAPVLLVGGGGPLDAHKRRPYIDWIHTSADQAALVRDFVKWDDQPLSPGAAVDAILRGHMLAMTAPRGPVYVNLDVGIQEQRLSAPLPIPPVERYGLAPIAPAPPSDVVEEVAELLLEADRAVVLIGRASRSERAWARRVELVERLGARVFTHLELPAAFPSTHPLGGAQSPCMFPTDELIEAVSAADVVLSLDYLDLGGTIARCVRDDEQLAGTIVSVSLEPYAGHGWSKADFDPVPGDIRVASDPDQMVSALLECIGDRERPEVVDPVLPAGPRYDVADPGQLSVADIAGALRTALRGGSSTLVRLPNPWYGALWEITGPLDYMGGDGGGGLGLSTGMTVGAALALRDLDPDRVPISIIGDGDYLMGVTALWTAVRHGIPLLLVILNNRSFLNDEIHQHVIADIRDRPAANRWIGQRIDDPAPDLAGMARAQGALGFGPVKGSDDLLATLTRAIDEVRGGAVCVVDVWVQPEPASPAAGPWAARHARGDD